MVDAVQCKGFSASGLAAGIKKNKGRDLALIYSEVPATVAGMFTRNRVAAAPVLLSKERVAGGVARAIVANAGNANCCTGPRGLAQRCGKLRTIPPKGTSRPR